MIKIAALVTAVVIALIVIITYVIARSASQKQDNAQLSVYKLRAPYFYFLVASIVVLLVVTLKSDLIPYAQTKAGNPDMTIEVTGRTWSWEISTTEIPAGKDIDFVLQTEDVTHGFGIFSPEGKIVAQAQVMPGYANHLRYKFEKSGEYKILCLEYCGKVHHNMISSFNVVENVDSTGTGGK